MNRENYRKVLDQIEAHPETWNQSFWHCGTTHCFAGWAQILSGKPADDGTVRRDARIYLDLSLIEADYLFAPQRTLDDLRDGYNRDGYNRAGLDRDGYNRAGYNRDGYNRDGLDRDGLDRAGYDRDGLDIDNHPKEAS
jgi:hypothetical protein